MTSSTQTKTKTQKGIYLYAVVDNRDKENYGNLGILKERVYSIPLGPVAAIVSDSPPQKLRPQRQNLAAHNQVLMALLKDHSVLPVSFGIVAKNPEEIQKLLKKNEAAFVEQLSQLEGKVEMGLRVKWDVKNIFEYMVNRHSLLKNMRDKIFLTGRPSSQEQKISLGNTFEKILDTERNSAQTAVQDVLKGYGFETRSTKLRSECEVMNLACLVGNQSLFEKAVEESAAPFDDDFLFDYNGPWAPHNFVDIKIEL